jgi:hypothetical protein
MAYNRIKNTGVILESPSNSGWRYGHISGGNRKKFAPDGQWDKFLPIFETQFKMGFESMACVSFSYNNCLETYFKAAFGFEPNFNDRYLATVSGTTEKGNTFSAVAHAGHKKGLADEETWPWDDSIKTWEDYYATPPSKAIESAMLFQSKYKTLYEWVEPKPEVMIDALQYGTLQVCSDGHAYMIYGYEAGKKWHIFDTYPYSGGTGKRTLPWSHRYLAAMLHTAQEETSTELLDIKNDCLVFEGTGPGRLGLHVNKKMFVDDPSKIQGQWLTRNARDGMFVGAPCMTISTENFSKFPRLDLKGNLLD